MFLYKSCGRTFFTFTKEKLLPILLDTVPADTEQKPNADEVKEAFREHIAQETLILCDGLKSYRVLPAITACTIKDCSSMPANEKCFYHLNTVNIFHSFIKRRYDFYWV